MYSESSELVSESDNSMNNPWRRSSMGMGRGRGCSIRGAMSVRYHRPLRYTRFGVGGRVFMGPLVSRQ